MEIIKKQAADEVEQAEDDNQYFSMKMKDYMGRNVKVARLYVMWKMDPNGVPLGIIFLSDPESSAQYAQKYEFFDVPGLKSINACV